MLKIGNLPETVERAFDPSGDLSILADTLKHSSLLTYSFSPLGEARISTHIETECKVTLHYIAMKLFDLESITSPEPLDISCSAEFLNRKIQAYKIGRSLREIYLNSDQILKECYPLEQRARDQMEGNPDEAEGQQKCVNALNSRARIFDWGSSEDFHTLQHVCRISGKVVSWLKENCPTFAEEKFEQVSVEELKKGIYSLSLVQMEIFIRNFPCLNSK